MTWEAHEENSYRKSARAIMNKVSLEISQSLQAEAGIAS
jgi:hypothetical protein